MQIIRDYHNTPSSAQHAVLALGNFDGVHLGHQQVIATARKMATEHNIPCAVMTFEPHPRSVFSPELGTIHIERFSSKIHHLEALGVDTVFAQRFNRDFYQITAQEFVEQVLVQYLRVSHVVTGDNFTFGKGRMGTVDYLRVMSGHHNFGYSVVLPVDVQGSVCSSSRVRDALRSGRMEDAAVFLGRPYSISGRVVHGAGRGKGLGYPTANIHLPRIIQPRLGIYAARVRVEGASQLLGAAVSLGVNPTFGGKDVTLEVHLLEGEGNLYGKRLEVQFISYLREEEKFDTVEALQTQMATDIEQVKALLWP